MSCLKSVTIRETQYSYSVCQFIATPLTICLPASVQSLSVHPINLTSHNILDLVGMCANMKCRVIVFSRFYVSTCFTITLHSLISTITSQHFGYSSIWHIWEVHSSHRGIINNNNKNSSKFYWPFCRIVSVWIISRYLNSFVNLCALCIYFIQTDLHTKLSHSTLVSAVWIQWTYIQSWWRFITKLFIHCKGA